ncbi:MAG: hypothetical protein N6V41_01095, partial [Candidatus Portiera aleyrodidarum]|nr:hypothetical protein [Candidatus Portiera aleyrodidarum]
GVVALAFSRAVRLLLFCACCAEESKFTRKLPNELLTNLSNNNNNNNNNKSQIEPITNQQLFIY